MSDTTTTSEPQEYELCLAYTYHGELDLDEAIHGGMGYSESSAVGMGFRDMQWQSSNLALLIRQAASIMLNLPLDRLAYLHIFIAPTEDDNEIDIKPPPTNGKVIFEYDAPWYVEFRDIRA
jgi:hypothetical protein